MTQRLKLLPILLAAGAAGCANGVAPGEGPSAGSIVQGGIEYAAETLILESFPVQLSTTVRMRNRSGARADVRLGSGCPVQLRVFKDAARTALAWDQGRVLVCTKEIQIVDLASGDSAQRTTRTNAREILGDSLPDGRYHLSAYVQVVGAPVLAAAGSADLAIPR
ncbi:MAG: hypothetical protein EXR95_00520 [Gemmatimonadetes bacterium]|nr:hypothetical protein [Gemmatimonadota bacterium]